MLKYTVTKNNICIKSSCQVPRRRFASVLAQIRAIHPNSDVWKRSTKSLKYEWATHNALYALGISKSHTENVDLNFPQKWYEIPFYAIIGRIVWPFIK